MIMVTEHCGFLEPEGVLFGRDISVKLAVSVFRVEESLLPFRRRQQILLLR
jgi:hypothetical protein